MPSPSKRLWRKNFEIKRASPLLGYEAMPAFYIYQHLTIGRKVLKEGLWIQQGVDNLATYFLKDELHEMIDLTMQAILNNPKKIHHLQQKAIKANADLFALVNELRKVNLEKYSDKKLYFTYSKLFNLMQYSHGLTLPTTWFIDSDGEDLSNYLINYVKNQIEARKLKLNFAEAFSMLTTPARYTLQQIEMLKSLLLIKEIKKDKRALKIFRQKDPAQIKKDLPLLRPALRRKIARHHYNWLWMPYTYLGPAYELEYYLQVWSGIIRQNINIDREIINLKNINYNNQGIRRELIRKLRINSHYRRIFDLACEIVWLKAYRKDAYFYACYVTDFINREIGKRLGLSLNQVRQMQVGEIKAALMNKKIDLAEIIRRQKYFIGYLNKNKFVVLSGKKAKDFLAKQNLEKVEIVEVNELRGTPACPGIAKGMVKIVNVPEEMEKMKTGDIMVAHTTFPALVPAIKKAAAIVTDDGGLTCHAAIVARELKKPCVVGTKMATVVLKDGDKVEVDAGEGVVRKVN